MKYRIIFSNGISTLLDYRDWDHAYWFLTKILGYDKNLTKQDMTAIIECENGIPF